MDDTHIADTAPAATLVHMHLGTKGPLQRWPEVALTAHAWSAAGVDPIATLKAACDAYAAAHGHAPSTLLLNSAAAKLLLARCGGGSNSSPLRMAAALRPYVPVQHVLVGDESLTAAAMVQAVHAHAGETLHVLGTAFAGRFGLLDATVSAFQAAARYQEEHADTALFHWPALFEVLRQLLPSSSELEGAFDDTMSEAQRVLAGASHWLAEPAILKSAP